MFSSIGVSISSCIALLRDEVSLARGGNTRHFGT